jgi:hypothetical protein
MDIEDRQTDIEAKTVQELKFDISFREQRKRYELKEWCVPFAQPLANFAVAFLQRKMEFCGRCG